jgi:hypothetical protein
MTFRFVHRAMLGVSLLVGLSAFESGGTFFSEREAGPKLPFSIVLPDGFRLMVRPGLDSTLFTARNGDEAYLTIWHGMSGGEDVKADPDGHFFPPVQQEIVCSAAYGPLERWILRLEKESLGSRQHPHPPLYIVVAVKQRLDLPAEKQAVADKIAASVFVPGLAPAMSPADLLTCPEDGH